MRKRVELDAHRFIREILIEEEALWYEYQLALDIYDRESESVLIAHAKWHVIYRLVKQLELTKYITRFKNER